MPVQWQKDFLELVKQIPECLKEFNELSATSYRVTPVNEIGQFEANKFPHYRHNDLTYTPKT